MKDSENTRPSFDDIDSWLTPDEDVALNNCDREPIHIPGTIQPHGALLVLAPDGKVLQASTNTDACLGSSAQDVSRLILERCTRAFPNSEGQVSERDVGEITIGSKRCSVRAHPSTGYVLCDVEPVDDLVSSGSLIAEINRASVELGRASSIREAYEVAVASTKRLTGFNRVLAYVFDGDGHGTVLAEDVDDESHGLLGIRFPGTDIPQQARRLYAVELTRQIVDVADQSVPVHPALNPVTGRPLNMAFSQLRSISPIHIEYLRNMGVQASFSISVVAQGELVGLLACHHFSPRCLDAQTRQACELLSRMISGDIASHEVNKRRKNRTRQLQAQVALLCELGGQTTQISVENEAWTRAFEFVDAPTLLLCERGTHTHFGKNPEQVDLVVQLCTRLAAQSPRATSSSRALGEFAPESTGGGALVVPFGEGRWLAWYRPPLEQTVRWAGRQEEDSGSKELTPRRSFETWQETIKGTSEAWSESELEMAELLRRGLAARFDGRLRTEDGFERAMARLREYVLYLEEHSQALARANVELGQFAHVASHDLRAPLRTIRSFLPLLNEEVGDSLAPDAQLWVGYIEQAANTLHRLQEGLWSYAEIERHKNVEPVDLTVMLESLRSGLAGDLQSATVTIGQLPTLEVVAPQVESLFRNLLDNASKYRATDRPLKIVVDHRLEQGQHVFSVSDNGIGFPPTAEERVFDLFSRVHPEKAEGDGLGLALCRRIVHHHRGWIRASSEPGLGSTFEFLLQSPEGGSIA